MAMELKNHQPPRRLAARLRVAKNERHDIENSQDLSLLIEALYLKLLEDQLLAPFFGNKLYIFQRLPTLAAYWERILWGTGWYRRHTMNIHRELAKREPFKQEHFDRWLEHFSTTVDELFVGETADKIKVSAIRIAGHMHKGFGV
ncbi:MAG: group III truncated hemoglobin [Pseudomonadales bacterium]|nr:group III truncated hemoglobin [Pseudomonadales bacterium]